jgi:hypothetical protein
VSDGGVSQISVWPAIFARWPERGCYTPAGTPPGRDVTPSSRQGARAPGPFPPTTRVLQPAFVRLPLWRAGQFLFRGVRDPDASMLYKRNSGLTPFFLRETRLRVQGRCVPFASPPDSPLFALVEEQVGQEAAP